MLCTQTVLLAQGPLPSPSPSPSSSPNDVEVLRQQVQALTETVKALQQQVKAQQDMLAKMNPEPATLPANENRPAPPTPAPA